jgi:predicted PurR-regulated permease PerM
VPSDRLRRIALIVWTAVGAVALGYVLLIVAGSVRVIWLPVAFAAGLVFLLEPAVNGFARMRVPRPLAAVLALAVLIAFILAVAALVLPTIREQAAELGARLPDLYFAGINWVREAGANLGLDVDELLSQQAIEEWLNDPANQETVQNLLLGFGAGAGQLIRGVAEAVAVLGLAPVLALYILIDLERFKANTLEVHRPGTARSSPSWPVRWVPPSARSFEASFWCR